MNKFFALTLLTCLCQSALALDVKDNEATSVKLNGRVIFFNGTLTKEAIDKTIDIYNKQKIKPTKMVISSDGGDIDLGMDFGEWIFNKKLDVQVDAYCLSSCANYIFPAAKLKFLGERAIIGYHGGASSQSFDLSEIDVMYKDLPDSERINKKQEAIDGMKSYLDRVKNKEAEFYKKIKIPQKISTLGQEGEYGKKGEEFIGWTYTPDGFMKLGLKDLILTNNKWNLTTYKGNRLFIVDVN
ncbi:hypothetical protein [Aeromonas veronii]|uniref:hypothetical protein n=1 Tax=Aeromonas veronii TaxID=654 RepID=UPI003D7FC551